MDTDMEGDYDYDDAEKEEEMNEEPKSWLRIRH